MLFALICDDRPGGLDIRKANRAAHLDYLKETGVVTQAGPLLDDAGGMVGRSSSSTCPTAPPPRPGPRPTPTPGRACSRRSRSGRGTA